MWSVETHNWAIERHKERYRIALDVKAGDLILFGKYSGQEIKLDGEEPRRTTPRAACYADASSYDIEVGGLAVGST